MTLLRGFGFNLRTVSRLVRLLPHAVLLLLATALAPAHIRTANVSTAEATSNKLPDDCMPLSEVSVGQRGYGLTVFQGSTPERFDIEVVGVQPNFRPRQALILIRTLHPRLDIARTVKGMSGSPIFVNDKMIGAYAYGFGFQLEPIAGVTPIESMLAELERPLPRPAATELRTTQLANRGHNRDPNSFDLVKLAETHRQRFMADTSTVSGIRLQRATTPLLLGGVGDLGQRIVQDLLHDSAIEVIPAGGGSQASDLQTPLQYVDGGAITVDLVRGDMNASGLGTVTRVRDGKLVAFGHPMQQAGWTLLPTSVGRINWILAAGEASFKLGGAAYPLGALVNDRQAAIVVDTTREAPMFPVKVHIDAHTGDRFRDWSMQLAHDPFMSPMFTAVAIGNAFEMTAGELGDLSWRASSRLKVRGYPALELDDFGAGSGSPPGPGTFISSRVVTAIGALLNNNWEDVRIESLETTIHAEARRDISELRAVHLLTREVRAGEPIRMALELRPYQGSAKRIVISVPAPPEAAGTDLDLEIAPGHRVRKPQAAPDNLGQLVERLGEPAFDARSVVVSYRLAEAGTMYRGEMSARLPAGALDTLEATGGSASPDRFVQPIYQSIPVDTYVLGNANVQVRIKPALR